MPAAGAHSANTVNRYADIREAGDSPAQSGLVNEAVTG